MVLANVIPPDEDAPLRWGIFLAFTVLPVVVVVCIFGLVYYKKTKASGYVKKFASDDPLWDEEYLKEYARSMFIRVNQAWLEMNFRKVIPLLTGNLKMEWISILKIMEQNELIYSFSSVDIQKVEIIGAVNHLDNNQDRVEIRISGYMRRHFRNRHTHRLTSTSSPGYDFFADLYTFTRNEETWLLDNIRYLAGFGAVMSSTLSKS